MAVPGRRRSNTLSQLRDDLRRDGISAVAPGPVEPSVVKAQLKACMEVCRVCAEECERHGGKMEHCRVCAAECRRCEEVCRDLLDQI